LCCFIAGRSNAINIAERLGLPKLILHDARKLYGAASAEIDEVKLASITYLISSSFLILTDVTCYFEF